MAVVETARGPIGTEGLGMTLMHEHVFVLTPDSQLNWPGEWDEDARVADAVTRLRELAASGVQTIVDPTVDGLGRDVRRIVRVNAEVDINIIVATGLYTYGEVPGYFRSRGPGALPDLPDPLVDLFVADIETGIQGTGVRAGLLKCATEHEGLAPGVERVLRAVAAAHLRTGVPVMVHTNPTHRTAEEVSRLFGELGVPPSRVQLAHSGDTTDADQLSALAERGYTLGMDRFGLDLLMPFDDRVGIVVEMCRRGFSSSMVLSQDASCYIDWVQPDLMPLLPNWTYLHVRRDVVPALLERGVTEAQVTEMLVTNPRRFFEGPTA